MKTPSSGGKDEAIAMYRKHIEGRPNDWEGSYHLAEIFYKQGKLDEAISVYQQILDIDDFDALLLVRFLLGRIFWEQGKPDKAAHLWNEAATLLANELKKESPDDIYFFLDAVVALLQGDTPRYQSQIEAFILPENLQEFLDNGDGEMVIALLFMNWLARPEQGWGKIINAIDKFELTTFGSWSTGMITLYLFSLIVPAIERQDLETQQIAKHIIAFGEGKIDLPTLKAKLAEYILMQVKSYQKSLQHSIQTA